MREGLGWKKHVWDIYPAWRCIRKWIGWKRKDLDIFGHDTNVSSCSERLATLSHPASSCLRSQSLPFRHLRWHTAPFSSRIVCVYICYISCSRQSHASLDAGGMSGKLAGRRCSKANVADVLHFSLYFVYHHAMVSSLPMMTKGVVASPPCCGAFGARARAGRPPPSLAHRRAPHPITIKILRISPPSQYHLYKSGHQQCLTRSPPAGSGPGIGGQLTRRASHRRPHSHHPVGTSPDPASLVAISSTATRQCSRSGQLISFPSPARH